MVMCHRSRDWGHLPVLLSNSAYSRSMEQVPIEMLCPKCGAKPYEPCKNQDELKLRSFHPERWAKAALTKPPQAA